MDGETATQLTDWRRRVFAMYQDARAQAENDPTAAWTRWRRARDGLFGPHPQSPLPADHRASFAGLAYFAYNPSCAYDPIWSCPLAPPGNHLAVAVHAGERTPSL